MLETPKVEPPSLLAQGGLVAVRVGFSVGLDHLQDLPPHVTVLGQDPHVVCDQGNGPFAAVVNDLQRMLNEDKI